MNAQQGVLNGVDAEPDPTGGAVARSLQPESPGLFEFVRLDPEHAMIVAGHDDPVEQQDEPGAALGRKALEVGR